ncbi:hypothetical protein HF1_10620 [Mycoplasma haemofelis str. Langford 1]|uniref:Uncharacterized protein n=1 Tax=Mycoplasma haemofelis (strain Langford 1) TaxID=941640 RepID=E8ZIU9_MYCHL|nr:hypothetical protein [Mycoplasma haemofelis]CBY93070.1 hypothetical protein HF1_10620 [Mycoplasma haemofelis str. Langford 1]
MALIGISKFLLGGSSLGIGAFGLGVSFLFPKASEEEAPITKTSLPEPEIQEEEVSESSDSDEDNKELTTQETVETEPEAVPEAPKVEEVVIPQCSIYEVKKPTGSGSSRKVNQIIQKIKDDKEKFLTWTGQTDVFKREIREACPQDMKESVDVYVWKEGGYWKYTKDIQKDWLADKEVQRPVDLQVINQSKSV